MTSLAPAAQPFLALTWSFNTTINVVTLTSAEVVGQGYEGRITLDKSTGSLVLGNLTEKDSGKYEVMIIPYGAAPVKGSAKLEVRAQVSRPTMACPTEHLIEGKTSVNLTCDGMALNRVWMKDGKPLVPGGRFSFHDGNRVLSINPVNRTDTGEFLCNVSNDVSFDTAKCNLRVFYGPDKPRIIQMPIGAELEDSVTLMCSADSLPMASFSWKFRNIMISGPVHYIHEMSEWHLGRDSADSLQCLLSCHAKGLEQEERLSHGVGLLPDRIEGAVGGTVLFTTMVTPPVAPIVVTIWDVADIHGTSTNIIISASTNVTAPAYKDRITLFKDTGSLELRNVTLRDSGEYNVNIIPLGEEQKFGSCKLLIHEPVSNVTVMSNTTDLLESNSSVRLSCSSSGSSLSFLWLNGSSEVTAGGRVQLTDGGSTLTIVNVTRYDQGPFRCHAINPVSNGTSDSVHLYISYGPENIALMTSPSQEYFQKGSNLSLSCSADSRPSALFQWFLNGNLLSDTGPELRLVNIQESQSGNYSCRAFNNKTLRHLTSLTLSLTVLAPVSNIKIKSSSTDLLESNSSVRLSCSSSGSSLSFLWLNGSSEVTAGGRVQLTDGGSTLTIVNVTRYDQGPFRCHVFNPFSNGTSDQVHLYISYGPENINLTRSPSQEHYDEGSDVLLKCSVVSSPSAQFKWFMNGDLMTASEPQLRLMNIQMHQSGNYTCKAFNNKTMKYQTSRSAAISVWKSQVSNVVVTPNTTELLELSSSVSLSCSAYGSFPSFLWLNSSSVLAASERVQITNDGTILTIANVTRYDQGPFTCVAFNNFSNYTSDPVKLTVSFGPENVHLTQLPSQEYFQKGSNLSLSCSADSRPSALFQWFLNGNLLSDTGPELRLVNVQESQSGNYSCRAFNNKTQKYQTSKPSVVSVISTVANVAVMSNTTDLLESNSSVRLSCSSSGSSLSFLWLNGSSEVTAGGRVQLTDGGSTLTIVNVTRYDQGPFRCHVSNGVSDSFSQTVNLIIKYGPDRVTIIGPDLVHVGDFTMLYCSTVSVPSAKFTWLLNQEPTDVHDAVYVVPSSQSSHSGRYTCTAKNIATGKSHTVHHILAVSEKLSGREKYADQYKITGKPQSEVTSF
ncbi:cell adhesion molecule CEACAM5-like [Aulostomus maculatus]